MEQRKKVTLKDIAARTGLSVNTVSRVLNKKPYYTKEVEERVSAACKELGYIVDMNASGLRSGSTRTVAILYDDLVNPFYSYTTDIISKRLEEHGYNSIMFSNNNRSPYADYELMRAVYSRKPDGVLSFLEPTEDLVPFIQNSGVPFVIFGRDGSPYGITGRIDAISNIVEDSVIRLRAVFDNPSGLLINGASANISIPFPRENCIVVPMEATFEIQDKIFVYKVVDGKATAAMIEVFELNNGKEYIVESGLSAGDVIVATGAGLLKEGTYVTDAAKQKDAGREEAAEE